MRFLTLLLSFFVSVNSALSLLVLTATAGGNVTLWDQLNTQIHAILFCGNTTLLNFDEGLIRIKSKNICVENGAIVMTSVQKNDSNAFYQLWIYNGTKPRDIYNITLNVTESLHQLKDYTSAQTTQSPNTLKTKGHPEAVHIVSTVVGLLTVIVLSSVAYWKREWLREHICVNRGVNSVI